MWRYFNCYILTLTSLKCENGLALFNTIWIRVCIESRCKTRSPDRRRGGGSIARRLPGARALACSRSGWYGAGRRAPETHGNAILYWSLQGQCLEIFTLMLCETNLSGQLHFRWYIRIKCYKMKDLGKNVFSRRFIIIILFSCFCHLKAYVKLLLTP